MAKSLILLEGHRSIGPLYVKAAQRRGLNPITMSTDPTQHGYLAAEGIETVQVDTNDLDAIKSVYSRLKLTHAIAGITGFSGLDESVYVTVGKLCRHFGLPGPDPASIEQCHDKFVQRQLLAQAGVAMPYYRMATNATEVESAAVEIGLPVVIKPVVGSGSSGVQICRTVDEVAEHTRHLLGGRHIWQSPPRILVEEFAQGQYFTADLMGGRVVGIGTGDFGPPPHFVYREYSFPAPLTDEEHARIIDISLSCLRALGLGWGPTNIEFRWTKRGPVVIEVNPRLAGTPDPQLIHLAYGIDLVDEHIKLVIGEECDLRARHSRTASARFLVPDRDGMLEKIEGANRAAAIPGVAEVKMYIHPNTPIVRKGDYRDLMGHVIGASPSRDQTAALLQQAADLISWNITPFPLFQNT
ncbi:MULTISPECIES: ATP-grasp domain-containing protein [Rhizobium]|uniref:Biotin carboxylase n=1 Tax=Rhizobium binae TaxID=1138190 RepID=A0ABV2MS29_9HYPH|nr:MULTISPECIES: acetyl-CoA carboxylase biotin carboxylase subunit family protein [Rhizobium]NKL52553.1 ATP-grasp domain-containing protein [Rhizobium leguminosarum bv. viciae]MBX4939166.1 ATP-grasp domain-containing protein [Rhizobium binae]MBX4945681.1 ATP-grasp domain-containing protein [Rhizobium binae]MBX4981146.1 ATP-grasp domain-containing protein [Rhizobium binae]MBX4995783.1 ATP-grasp domain-containing protein [Rhizobium binae]